MKLFRKFLRGAVDSLRADVVGVVRASERTVMVGTALLLTAFSLAMTYVLAQYFSVDVMSSVVFFPEDCWGDWGMTIGRHCFSDYGMVATAVMQKNPWEPFPLFPPFPLVRMQYPAAGMIPHLFFAVIAKFFGSALVGLVGYTLALTVAVLSPAIWAARGARGLERIIIFVTLGVAAVPAWMVVDRGNSTGFLVPIALIFLIALCRQRWGLAAVMVVLASLVKPQFGLMVVALFAVRQWRTGAIASAAIVVSNIIAYLAWPSAFPETIKTSISNFQNFNGANALLFDVRNVSFSKALLLIPDNLKAAQIGTKVPEDFLVGPRTVISYGVLLIVVLAVLALGRRVPAVMVGILLLVTATLSPPQTLYYYLVCLLPVAALVARDPDGAPGVGLFEQFALQGDRRRAVGICLSLAAAFTVAEFALPGPISNVSIIGIGPRTVTATTTHIVPVFWLIACFAIIVSYARRPATQLSDDESNAAEETAASGLERSATDEISES